MKSLAFIYILIDPRTGEVRYVGSTIAPEERFRAHLSPQAAPSVRLWVLELRIRELKPRMEVVAEVAEELRFPVEQGVIQHYAQTCKLLNVATPPRRSYQVIQRVPYAVPGPPAELSGTTKEFAEQYSRKHQCTLSEAMDILTQEAEEYAALLGMLWDDAHPWLAEDPDLEDFMESDGLELEGDDYILAEH